MLVVGGGISGLAAAHYLGVLGSNAGDRPRVRLLEQSDRLGGKVRSVTLGGLQVEGGADSFVVRKPWAVELCRDLGLEDRVVIPGAFGAAVWTRGRLMPFPERSAFGVPASVASLLRWPGLSLRARIRALGDVLMPATKGEDDQALGAVTRRRLGREASLVLVEPLLAGLHAGDPLRLSVRATFPEIEAWERDQGGLMLGARAAVKAAERTGKGHKPLFATLWGGLGELVDALAHSVGPSRLTLRTSVSRLVGEGEGFVAHAGGDRLYADAMVLCTPAFEASRLMGHLNPAAARELELIRYASTGVVVLAYAPGSARVLPETGTGFVVPVPRTITACTWFSRKWPSPQFGDRAVVRCFVGKAGADLALRRDDRSLARAVVDEVAGIVPLGEPEHVRVVRWDRSMPQYEVGHLDRIERIEKAIGSTPGLFVAGSAYHGVGIADCIRQGREAAESVLRYLAERGWRRTRLVGHG